MTTTSDAPMTDTAFRKVVTVMFADLVGSTAFGESVDPESARREMATYYELCNSVISRHQGTVVKFIGDGVMAMFGIPEIAADDAARAVRAGLDLQREFVTLGEEIRARHGSPVGLRVGINTGEIVIDLADDDMVGDAINIAARIEAQCTPGKVLVGEQTWRLTRTGVDYEILGEVSLKGRDEPVATFQAIAAVEDEEIATPFVGRTVELNQLGAVLDDCVTTQTVRLATVIGTPGVGKTRLATELASRLEGGRTHHLRVDREGAASFEPIADLLREVTGLDNGTSGEEVDRALATLAIDAPDADRLLPILASFLGATTARSTEESLWGCRRLIELLGEVGPVIITVDDVQWATPLFLDLLEHLVEWATGPVLLLALARPELREHRPILTETGRRVAVSISLEGLDAATTAALAEGILEAPLPDGLAERLPVSTEGNPLFVREFVRMLVDDGTLVNGPRVDGTSGWTLAIDAAEIDVPPTITSLLAARVERMDEEERRVVEKASVVGAEFTRGAVADLLPHIGTGRLDRILERLRRQEIIDATGSYWGDESIWRFHHALIRDAAYRRLLKERRAELHQKVAEWTAATAARLGSEAEITVAFHYEQAHEYLTQLETPTATAIELGGRAADLLTTAANRALNQDDLLAAGALALRGLARLDRGDPRRLELLLIGCEAFFGAAHLREAEPLLEELHTHRHDNARLGAWAAAFEGQQVVFTAPERLDEIEPAVAAAAEALTDLGDKAGEAKARLVRALILARQGRVGACEAELDAALEAARAIDDRRRITAILAAAPVAALWGPSPVARAGGRCLDIVRLLRITTGSPMVEATSVRCQAVLEAMRGRFEEARRLIARSGEITDELGFRHGVLETAMFAGYIELLAGEPAAAESHLEIAHTGLGRIGIGADAGQAASLRARAMLSLGRLDEAEELARASEANAGRNLQTAIASRAARAEIQAALGNHANAELLAREAAAIAAGTDLTMDHAVAMQTLATVLSARDDPAPAARAQAEATRLFEAKGAVLDDEHTVAPVSEAATSTSVEVYVSKNMEAIRNRSLEDWTALHTQDFEFVSHRAAMPVAELGLELAAQTAIELARNFDGAISSETIANVSDRIGVFRITWGTASTAEMVWISVFDINAAGLGTRAATFEEDAERDALAHAREWAGSKVITLPHTSASDPPQKWAELFARGDNDGILALMSPDFSYIDNRDLFGAAWSSIEEIVASNAVWQDYDAHLTNEVIAVRGDRLVLVHNTTEASDGFQSSGYIVGEVDNDGLTCHLSIYGEDSQRLANDELNARYVRPGGEGEAYREIVELVGTVAKSQEGDGSLAEVQPYLSNDFEFRDLRVLAGSMDSSELGRLDESDVSERILLATHYLAQSNDCLLVHTLEIAEAAASSGGIEWSYLALFKMTDHKIQTLEVFESTDSDQALERFRELTGNHAAHSASTRCRRFWDLVFRDLDLDGAMAMITADAVSIDQRRLVASPVLDRAGVRVFLEMLVHPRNGLTDYSVDILEARGDRLALARISATDSVGAWSEELLQLYQVNVEGQIERVVSFTPEDLDVAIAALDSQASAMGAREASTPSEA